MEKRDTLLVNLYSNHLYWVWRHMELLSSLSIPFQQFLLRIIGNCWKIPFSVVALLLWLVRLIILLTLVKLNSMSKYFFLWSYFHLFPFLYGLSILLVIWFSTSSKWNIWFVEDTWFQKYVKINWWCRCLLQVLKIGSRKKPAYVHQLFVLH